jgi:flagellar motor protein MotB
MTVLAVVGLVTTVSFLATQQSRAERQPSTEELEAERLEKEEAKRRAAELARERDQLAAAIEEVRRDLEEARKDLELASQEWDKERTSLEQAVVRNKKMFHATQRAQKIIDRIAKDDLLQFDFDQSLRLGDELVRFERNKVEPLWQSDGPQHLRHFCTRLSEEFDRLKDEVKDPVSLFTILVEGHTDSTRCPGDDLDCNWSFSSQRAVSFLELMRDDEICPGGAEWQLRPIGYADTRPVPPAPGEPPVPTRRISLRVVPDYERWTAISEDDAPSVSQIR